MMRWVAVAAVVVALLGCRGAEGKGPASLPPVKAPPAKSRTAEVTDENYSAPALPRARITVTDAYGGKHPVDCEVASTSESRTRGLMWRTELPEGKGMIFLFPVEDTLTFWMKNTLIPLDMIFITAGKKVAGCVEQAEPRTLSSRGVGRASQFVLEVPSGWCAKVGIKPGSPVLFEGTDGLKISAD